MANFVVLLLSFVAGCVLRLTGKFSEKAPAALNAIILSVCLPAVALLHLHQSELSGAALFPILMPWIFFGLATAIFAGVCQVLGLSRGILGALVLTGGLGNTSFVGFPLVEAFYGTKALSVAVLVDQPGSFLALSTVGILTASLCSRKKGLPSISGAALGIVLKRVLTFPPLVGLIAALALRPVAFPPWMNDALARLASPLAPLAMASVGAQLRLNPRALRARATPLALGLAVKLIAAPAAILALALALGIHGDNLRVTILEAAMSPMITGAIVAEEFGLDTELANLMVSIGIPLSAGTVAIWAAILTRF